MRSEANSMSPEAWIRRMPRSPVAGSDGLGWRSISAYRFQQPERCELGLPSVSAHFIVAHLRNPARINARWNGRWTRTRSAPGSIMIVPAHQETFWDWQGDLWELQLLLDADLLTRAASEFIGRPVELVDGIGVRDPEIWDIARAAEREISSPKVASRLFADILAQRLALALLRGHSNAGRPVAERPTRIARHRLRRAIEFIESELANDLPLSAIADAAGLSEGHFARGFKESTGLTPHRFLLERRLARAKELLRSTEMTVARIAAETGFSSQSHLATAMRECSGVTPTRYRALTSD